jgi:di/tricarboxylate transporter
VIEASLVIGVFFLLILLFYSGKVGIDAAALFGLALFLLFDLLTPEQAFAGFASDAVLLMVGSFFLSGALKITGVGNRFGHFMVRFSGQNTTRAILITIFFGAAISSVMNNVAAVAVMLPAVATLSQRARVAPHLLYMPLTFAVLLGGTSTLIGTSSNLLAAEALTTLGYRGFTMLEFLPLGITLVFVGALYFITIGRKLLSVGRGEQYQSGFESLTTVYQLSERLFGIQIPINSPLHGKSLGELDFNHLLGMDVLTIQRGDQKILRLNSSEHIYGGDKLIVRGRSGELKKIIQLSEGALVPLSDLLTEKERDSFVKITFKVTKELLTLGTSIAKIDFRKKTGFHVAVLKREKDLSGSDIPHAILRLGDVLVAFGPKNSINNLLAVGIRKADYKVEEILDNEGLIFGFKVPSSDEYSNISVRNLGFQEVLGVTVIALKRNDKLELSLSGNALIQSEDNLIIVGDPEAVHLVNLLSKCKILDQNTSVDIENDEFTLQEVVLSPRSKLIGKSLQEVSFAARYGLKVISLWRNGEPKRTRFTKAPLQFGDTLLLRGDRAKLELLGRDSDFVVLGTDFNEARRPEKSVWALFALFLLVFLSALQIFPASVTTLTVAVLVVITGAIRMDEAYREIDWRLVMIIGALIPFQTLFPQYGITQQIASWVSNFASTHEMFWVILIMVLVSSLITQLLDSTIAVIGLAPVAIAIANSKGIAVQPLVMAVAIGASLGFMSPLGHRAHLLVIAPGGYKAIDFLRVGTLLAVITSIIVTLYCLSGTGM